MKVVFRIWAEKKCPEYGEEKSNLSGWCLETQNSNIGYSNALFLERVTKCGTRKEGGYEPEIRTPSTPRDPPKKPITFTRCDVYKMSGS